MREFFTRFGRTVSEISAALLIICVVSIFSAWAMRHVLIGGTRFTDAQSRFILSVASFPRTAIDAWNWATNREPVSLLLDRATTEKSYWTRKFPSIEDRGYVLFSGVDHQYRQAVVKLISVSDGKTIALWKPNWTSILQQLTDKTQYDRARAINPLILNNGDLIFNVMVGLVRLDACSGEPKWVLDKPAHHSIELDNDGGIWVPGVSQLSPDYSDWVRAHVRDDALLKVSQDGVVEEEFSFLNILRENGLESLAFGTAGNLIQPDPVHINQIAVARIASRYWIPGDLLISSRHLSTVFLYRPSSGKILWHRTGPWINQHSAAFVNDHEISVFDNHALGGGPEPFLTRGDINHVVIYDFDSDKVSEPFGPLLAKARPSSRTEGRAQVLADGGLFLEDTNSGRLLRFSKDRLLWSKVNDYDAAHIGMVFWSRYLTAEEGETAQQVLASRNCR